jgi:opacity protein-like surface antigen
MPLEASPISRRRGDSGVANEGSVISRLRRSDRGGAGLSRRSIGDGSAAHPVSDPRPAGLRGRLELVCAGRSRDQFRRRADRLAGDHLRPAPRFAGSPLPVYSGQNIHATDFSGGVGAGYRFNNYLRFDGTWDYRTGPGGSSNTTVVCPYALTGLTSQFPPIQQLGYLYNTTNTCIGSANINQHNNTFLGNAYVDLGTYYGFTPYVGGGLGFNINTMSGSLNFNETANGQPYAADLTPTGTYPQLWIDQFGRLINPQPNIAFSPQNWNRSFSSTTYSFAWALSAGLGFQLTPSATLDVGYRYLNSGAITNLINPQTGMTVKQNNWSQQIRVGLRYAIQ